MENTDKKTNEFNPDKAFSSHSLYVNTLIDIVRNLRDDEEGEREFEEICKILESLSWKMLFLYENLKDFFSFSEKTDLLYLKEKLEDFSICVVKVKDFVRHKNRLFLCKSLNELCEKTEDLFVFFSKTKREGRNPVFTGSPFLNELILSVREVSEGRLPEEALSEKVRFLKGFIESTKEQIYNASGEIDSVTLYDELPEIFLNLDFHQKGLDEILLYTVNKDKKHLRKGMNFCLKATERLFSSLDLLYEAADIITKIICLKCGHKNSIHMDHCVICRSVLPKVAPKNIPSKQKDYVYESEDFCYMVTDNLNILLEGVSFMEEGKISPEEFFLILSFMEEKTSEAERKLDFKDFSGSIFLTDLRDIFNFAFNEIREGLKILSLYAEDRNKDYMDRGLTRIFEATRYFYYIQNVGLSAEKEQKKRQGMDLKK